MTIATRRLGRTNWKISEIGFGAWAIGGSWGDVDEADARASVHAALDAGMTFIDHDVPMFTATGAPKHHASDCSRSAGRERPIVATKAGRRLNPHVAEGYTKANLEAFDASEPLESRRRCVSRPGPAPLPADRGLLPPGGVRGDGRSGCGRQDPLLWRIRREGGGGSQGTRL